MDRDANYVTVGAFVLLVLAMATAFVVWYTETGDRREYQRYEIYFEGSVFGLSEGGSVRYLGVAVGRVARIGLDPRDPGRVLVLADISDDTPIESETVARLALQGVTGLLFVDLKPADPEKPQAPRVDSITYQVIPAEQSDFDVFVSSLPDVVARAGETLNRVNAVLSDQNIAAVGTMLANVEAASRDLPATMADARAVLADLRTAAGEIEAAASGIRQLTEHSGEEVGVMVSRLRDAADNFAKMSARLDLFVANNEQNFDRFADQGLAEIEQMVRETRRAVRAFEALSNSLEQDPSRLIYQPAPSGVEIPK